MAVDLSDHGAEHFRAQGLLDRPEERFGFPQGNGEELIMGKTQSSKAVAIEPSPFDIAMPEPAPEDGAGAIIPFRVSEREAKGKTHGSRGMGIGAG